MSLARLLPLPLQPSGVRGWTRFSTVILHYKYLLFSHVQNLARTLWPSAANRASTPMVSCCRLVVGRCSRGIRHPIDQNDG